MHLPNMHLLTKPAKAHVAQDKVLEPVYYPEESEIAIPPWSALYVDLVEFAKAQKEKREERRAKIIVAIMLTVFVLILALTAVFWDKETRQMANETPEIDPLDSKLYHKDRNPEPDNILLPRHLEELTEIDNLPDLDQCETNENCEAGDYCFKHFCFEKADSATNDADVSTSGSRKGKKRKPKKPKKPKAPDFPPPQGCQVWSQPCEKDSDCCTLKCKRRGPGPTLCESWKEWMPCKRDEDCWSGHCQRREDWIWPWKVCHPE